MSESEAWGLLNTGIAINCGIIAIRLFVRAAQSRHHAGARIIYGLMFASGAVFCAILSFSQWKHHDGRPEAGLVGLLLIWITTTAAVLYLVVLGRNGAQEVEGYDV